MKSSACNINTFGTLTKSLVGMVVSSTRKGYGSAIYIELGRLHTRRGVLIDQRIGEAAIWVEWDWRVEAKSEVLFGSSNSGPYIAKKLLQLKGLKIAEISLYGTVPEIAVTFSNGNILRSMVMHNSHPRWTVRLVNESCIAAETGKLWINRATQKLTAIERNSATHANRTAARWGRPGASSRSGNYCKDCQYYIPIDGNFSLLDYGVCTASRGTFDGRIVNIKNSCEKFRRLK